MCIVSPVTLPGLDLIPICLCCPLDQSWQGLLLLKKRKPLQGAFLEGLMWLVVSLHLLTSACNPYYPRLAFLFPLP